MIGRVAGTLLHRGPDQVLIDVAGLGYVVHVSQRTAAALPAVGAALAGSWSLPSAPAPSDAAAAV